MPTIKLRRNNVTNNIIPQEGEPLYNLVTKKLYVGDGVTVGGNCINTEITNVPQDTTHRFVTDDQINEWDAKESPLNKGASNGYAGLDASGKIPMNQIPSITINNTATAGNQSTMLTQVGVAVGDVCVRTDLDKSYILNALPSSDLANWTELLITTQSPNIINQDADHRFVTDLEKNKWNNPPTVVIADTNVSNSDLAMLALANVKVGDVCIRTDVSKSYICKALPSNLITNWSEILVNAINPTSIVQDTTHRFVTDSEKTTWGNKQINLGYTPENVANKDIANGYAGLGSDGKISTSVLPSISLTDTFVVGSQSAMLSLTCQVGDVAVRSDLSKSFILRLAGPSVLGNWQELLTPSSAVVSVNGMTGAVTVSTITGNAGTVTGVSITPGKVLTSSNSLTLAGTDGSSLNIGAGGTLGSAAYTSSSNYATAAQGTLAANALPSASYTASDVLTKMLTVDGTGSNLDADLLDGQQGSYYLAASHAADAALHLTSGQNTLLDALAVSSTELNYSTGVTSAIQTQLNAKQASLGYTAESTANKNIANGYAGLDVNGKLSVSQVPSITLTDTFVAASQVAQLGLTCDVGDVCVRTDINKTFILKLAGPAVLSNWQELLTPTDSVTSVNGSTGAVTVTNILGNAATVTGLSVVAGKILTANNTLTLAGTDGSTLNIGSGGTLGTAAYVATGTFATAAQGTLATNALPSANFTDVAVTSKVITGFAPTSGVISVSDSILSAINKLAGNVAASGSGTVTSASVVTANGVSGTVATPTTTPAITLSFTTQTAGNNSTNVATTAFVGTAITNASANYLASSGSPVIPATATATTQTTGTSNTTLATTAFVAAATSAAGNASSSSFNIQYTASNPTSATGLPSGWTATFNYGGNPTSVMIAHTMGKPLADISYWGADSSVSGQTLRLPNSTYKAVVPTANPNSQFVIDIPGSATSTDPGGICRIVASF